MPTVAVYDMTNNKVGDIELSEEIFGVEINEGLVHQAVVMQMASWRLGTHSTKTRGLVRGGGRKPWRQKALASKRYRQSPRRFAQKSSLARRRYNLRTSSPRLFVQHAEKTTSPRVKMRPHR